MKIPIKPVQVFVPGKGLLTATLLSVTVGHYDLGVRVRGHYEVIALVPVPRPPYAEGQPVPPVMPPKEVTVANGQTELTPEQFATWVADDAYFCRCIAENAGLTPA